MKNKVLIIFKYHHDHWNIPVIDKFSNFYETEHLYISDYKNKNFADIVNDINNLKGYIFEKLVKKLLIFQNKKKQFIIEFESIWNYWDRWGNEIDLVCINNKTKRVVFIETKLQWRKITKRVKDNLIKKSESISEFKNYKKYYKFYSLNNLDELLY